MFPKKPDCILKAFSQPLGGFELASPSQLPQTLAEARQRDLEERPTYRGGGQKSGVIFRHVLVGSIQFLGDFLGDVDSFSVGTFFFGGGAVEIFDSSPMISQEMVLEKSTFSHAGMYIAMFGHLILGEWSNSTEFTLELKEEIRDVDPHVQLHCILLPDQMFPG